MKTHVIEKLCVGGSILEMRVDGTDCRVDLMEFSYRLGTCTEEQRKHVQVIADGAGLYWPDVDEMLVVDALLAGENWRVSQPDRWDAAMERLSRRRGGR